jgi:hypothetical protein
MSDQVQQHNIGAIAVEVSSVAPVASAAATINGTSIDRQKHSMPLSCILRTSTGAETGAPSGVSVQSTLQHSPDNSTWANFLYDGTNTAQGAAITAVNSDQNYPIDLALANRYLRVVTVISFTGGTSPTIGVNAGLILGGEQTLAAV